MAPPERQLQTRAKIELPSNLNTYTSIKNCLDTGDWNGEMNFKRYLQGSYKNTTNIANSDVNVVVEMTSTFYSNKRISAVTRKQYDEYYSNAKFGVEDFKSALLTRLKNYYGEDLIEEEGEKAIRIKAVNGRLDADVVCYTYVTDLNLFNAK